MQRVILLTEEEYTSLKNESPSGILQATLTNLKTTNEAQQKQIYDLKSELQTYVLGGATKKPQEPEEKPSEEDKNLNEIIQAYNIVAHAIQTKAIKPVISLTASYFQIEPTLLKNMLKDAVNSNLIERTKDNTYIRK